MANIQKQFLKFHKEIKIKEYSENKLLREKRDIILNKLRDGLEKLQNEEGKKKITFDPFNQGSYAMGTGIKPVEGGDFDIDVGLLFRIDKNDYEDPVTVKQLVYDALEGHTTKVEIRKPCVTVTYVKEGEDAFHVDLAVYVHPENNSGLTYLARGKKGSKSENKFWEDTEPKEFIEYVKYRFDDSEDNLQFRRIIRYLKRWKDEKFPSNGNAAPLGVGITCAALELFSPSLSFNEYDDLTALIRLIEKLIGRFGYYYHDSESEYGTRIVFNFPFKPGNDVFAKMSNNQMEKFKAKLETLLGNLREAQDEVDPVEACKKVAKALCVLFPIPAVVATAKVRKKAVVSSSESA